MPRTKNTKNWTPDAFEQKIIDKFAAYAVAAERCAQRLRGYDFAEVERLWGIVQTEFNSNPSKYPCVMAPQNDLEGRRQFHAKCEAICFPAKPPSRPEE
jgi:hypothetical protein